MTDITIPDAAVEAFKAAWHAADDEGRQGNRVSAGLAAAAPYIAAQERRRVADEIDLPAVMAHLLRGSRDDLILADRINVAVGASRVRQIEADRG